MSGEEKKETHIHGIVEKITNIGIVKGDVLIVSNEALKKSLNNNWNPRQTKLVFPSQDVTDYINVIIKSNRFGRKTQFRAPKDITIRAFINIIVGTLNLPWQTSNDELMISFRYRYSIIYKNEKISPNKTLSDAQIFDGDVVELSISVIWTDEIEKAERAEAKMDVIYEMMGRMNQLEKRRLARAARGIITNAKIKSWANKFFEHVDRIGVD